MVESENMGSADDTVSIAMTRVEAEALLNASFGDEHDWDAFDRAIALLATALKEPAAQTPDRTCDGLKPSGGKEARV